MAGYSGTPLIRKLGLKEGFRTALVQVPLDVAKEIGISRASTSSKPPLDFVHLFVRSQTELETKFPSWAAKLAPAGMLWVSWPKKGSGVESDLNENVVREMASPPVW